MQTNYRESVRKDAELFKMNIASEIAEIENKNDIAMEEKDRVHEDQKRVYMEKVQAEIAEANEQFLLELQNINKRKEELQLELEIFNKDAAAELNAQIREADLKVSLARNENTIAKRKEDVKIRVA